MTLDGVFTLVSIMAPFVMNRLGPRQAIVLGSATYGCVVVTYLFPAYYSTTPAMALCGLGAVILWAGQGVYLGRNAIHLAREEKSTIAQTTSRLNSLFWTMFQAAGSVGLFLSSSILMWAPGNARNTLFIVMTIMAFGATGLLMLLPSVAPVEEEESTEIYAKLKSDSDDELIEHVSTGMKSLNNRGTNSVGKILTLLVNPKLYLVLPFCFYNGVTLAFFNGDFTKYVGAPILGRSFNGFVVAAFFLSNSIFTFICGKIAEKRNGRKFLVSFASVVHLSYWIWLIFLTIPTNYVQNPKDSEKDLQVHDVSHTDYLIAFGGAVVFALGDCVWESLLPAILQTYFQDSSDDLENSMINSKMVQSLGFSFQFVLGFVLEHWFHAKIYIIGGLLIFCALCLSIVHVRYVSVDGEKRKR